MLRPKSSGLRRQLSLLGSLVLAGACGCMECRLLHETPEGGVVSIPNNSNQWPTYYRNRAEYLMHQKCPEGYVIDREEVVADNPAAQDGRKPYEHYEYNGAYERITKYLREEYHLTFHRVGSGRRVPPPSVAPGAAIPTAPAAKPLSPAEGESKEELPPPRPLPPLKKDGDNP